jgi:hypothetical protein
MQALTRHAGMWTATTRFRLMPEDPPAVADAAAQLSLGAGWNLAVLAYTWTHPDDGAQDGLLVLGPDESPGGVLRSGATPGTRSPRPSSCVGRPATTR